MKKQFCKKLFNNLQKLFRLTKYVLELVNNWILHLSLRFFLTVAKHLRTEECQVFVHELVLHPQRLGSILGLSRPSWPKLWPSWPKLVLRSSTRCCHCCGSCGLRPGDSWRCRLSRWTIFFARPIHGAGCWQSSASRTLLLRSAPT